MFYGRAVAAYQLSRYDAAAKDLRGSLTSFPNGDSFLDTEFLLSVTLATQANLALGKESRTPVETTEATARYTEAEKLLADIIRKHTDLSLANEAQFQLGETIMAQAASSPDASQAALYKLALAAYRAVEPKEPMVAAQQARVQSYKDARLAERRKGPQSNPAQARKLIELQGRESGKLAALKAKPDTVIAARVKSGAAFVGQRLYDETRVLMTALAPEVKAARGREERSAITPRMTYAAQNATDRAEAAYDKFHAQVPGATPSRKTCRWSWPACSPVRPGQGRQSTSGNSAKYYPNSRLREMAMLQQAQVTRPAAASTPTRSRRSTRFLKGNPKREYAAMAELARAAALRDTRDLDGALAAYRKVRDSYKGRPQAEEAGFWVASVDLQKEGLRRGDQRGQGVSRASSPTAG